uniref:BCLAF1 and THRAP3 family member 3 n=1 Tax=Callorhinchus milii TaxID=7868 RepID=A0A4W3I4H6_CALMI
MIRSRSRSPRWRRRSENSISKAMNCSRSRSPRWRRRSISPSSGRSQEYHMERQLHHGGESRGFNQGSGQPMYWGGQRGMWREQGGAESRSGNAQYIKVNNVFEIRQPSPNSRRLASEHSSATGRNVYPTERKGNRTYPPSSRFPEDNPYHDHDERHRNRNEWHQDHVGRQYHQSKEVPIHDRILHGKPQTLKNESRVNSYDRPSSYYGCEKKWHESEGVRSHGLHEERHSGHSRSPGRHYEEFLDRSSYQKRYPEGDNTRRYREAFGGGREPGSHEVTAQESNLKWKWEKSPHRKGYSSKSYCDSEKVYVKDVSRERYPSGHRFEEYAQVKSGFEYSQKIPMARSSEYHKSFSSERRQEYSNQEDRCLMTSSLSSKEVSRFHSNNRKLDADVNRTEGHHTVSGKYSSSENSSDRFQQKDQLKAKQVIRKPTTTSAIRGRDEYSSRTGGSEGCRDMEHKGSDHRSSHMETSRRPISSNRNTMTESLTIKVNMKKTLDKHRPTSSHASERLMSRDLVSVGKKRDEFHHVFEHMGSSFKANSNIASGQFAQEIITLVHQIKGEHFKSSGPTLHDRFSKLQNAQYLLKEEGNHLGPEIHRCIDMSLSDLHNRKRKNVGGKISTWVATNPDDLRHDIERRRKERLQDSHEESFQTAEQKLISHRSKRHKKSHFSQVKVSRSSQFKPPSDELIKDPVRRVTKKTIVHVGKDYPPSGRFKPGFGKRGFTMQSKYMRVYGVGFGWANHKIFTKHFREDRK